jgi:hypothetical protein
MKKLSLIIALAFTVALSGCSKDSEISAFITEWDAVTAEMVQKINSGDVDGAKASFDQKKPSLQSKWDSIKTARGFQVSADSKKKLEESLKKNMSSLASSMTANSMKLATDKAKFDKLRNLIDEYGKIFTP